MCAVLGASLFGVIAIIYVMAILGMPVGEFIMGGQNKVLPSKQVGIILISVMLQLFAMMMILQAGGFIGLWFSFEITRGICFFLAGYLSINVVMNLMSKSKKERYMMTPLSLVVASCFWITAINMV